MPEWPSTISLSVAPVVIISACGLLSLVFYGRLAAMASRLRGFQRETLKEQEKPRQPGGLEQARLLELLRKQTEEVRQRARLIRLALMFFLTAVALLIVCSLTLMLSRFVPVAAFFAAVFFGLGLFRCSAGSSRRCWNCAERCIRWNWKRNLYPMRWMRESRKRCMKAPVEAEEHAEAHATSREA